MKEELRDIAQQLDVEIGYCNGASGRNVTKAISALRDAASRIESLEKDCEELIKERDEREDVINELLNQVLCDERKEWSSAYDFSDAVIDVECKMKSLEKDAARYRWLRNDRVCGDWSALCGTSTGLLYEYNLDLAIDSAIKADND